MRLLFGLSLAWASTAWATPLTFTGTSSVGSFHHDLFLNGNSNGFAFGNAAPDWYRLYTTCSDWTAKGCDLSYDFQVITTYGFDFYASNGSTITGNVPSIFSPPGAALGHLTWTAKPLPFSSPPEFGASVVIPITLSGYLKAWTPEELAASAAPFFDYSIIGTGYLSAYVEYASPTTIYWGYGSAVFAGVAEPTPEPPTWMLALGLGIVPIWLCGRRLALRSAAEKTSARGPHSCGGGGES